MMYEVQSFLQTFIPVYWLASWITMETDLAYVVANWQVLLGSLWAALLRTIIIYWLAKMGIYDYRQSTSQYK